MALVFCRVLEVIDSGFGIEVKLRDKQRNPSTAFTASSCWDGWGRISFNPKQTYKNITT